ncbi:MAG TPA: CBASS cGAMP-activated phospholipase [Pirellulales bacterium]|nr:CBASS cGAMP-activated phospholipase [Pirellulales bacterium]
MSHREKQSNQSRPFRILALDGGGIRGAFAAAFLACLEERLGCRTCDYFDLVAGTSTGAIIAAALATGEPASRVEVFYRDRGPVIFRRSWERPTVSRSKGMKRWMGRLPIRFVNRRLRRWGVDHDWLWHPKYEVDELQRSLEEVFGQRSVESIANCRLVVPSVDLTRGQTVVFKTPHLPGLIRDRRFRIVDVLLSTTAAPTYLPQAVIGPGSAYIDGGVWANNPSMVAVAEALRIREVCRRDGVDPIFGHSQISLLSVGTGTSPYFAHPPERGGGIVWWAPQLLGLMGITQAQGVHFQCRYILNDRYERVDYSMPDDSWKLDAVGVIDQLVHIGRSSALEKIGTLKSAFYTEPTQRYVPFEDIVPLA